MTINSLKLAFVRLWHWLKAAAVAVTGGVRKAFAAPAPLPSSSTSFKHRSDLTAPLVVPARGSVFHFKVHAMFEWSSGSMDGARLRDCSRQWQVLAERELHRCVGARSRNFEPHRAHALEESVNQLLATKGEWRFGNDVTCRPTIWVELGERGQEQMRAYAEERIRMECEHEAGVRRSQLTARLSRRWLGVLEDLMESPLAGGAAKLTDPRVAEVVEDLLGAQGGLADLYMQILKDDSLGGFEQARAHDGLLDHLDARSYKPQARSNGHRDGRVSSPS